MKNTFNKEEWKQERARELEEIIQMLYVPLRKYSSNKLLITPNQFIYFRRIKQRIARSEAEYYALVGQYYRPM